MQNIEEFRYCLGDYLVLSGNLKIIVVLGAGASRAFSLPDMRSLTNEIVEKYRPFRQTLSRIRASVTSFGFDDDVESLLSVLEFWSNPKSSLLEAGPFASTLGNLRPVDLKIRKDFKKLAFEIKNYIVRRCFVNDLPVITKIESVYGRFFRETAQKFNLPLCNPGHGQETPSLDIFTTNYDNVIEEYCRSKGAQVCDGFKETFRGNYVFDVNSFPLAQTDIRLHKLHGTVTYLRLANGQLDRTPIIPQTGPLKIGGQLAFPELIYPGTHNYISKEPQLELLFLFKQALQRAEVVLIIGYSFRDPNIVEILRCAVNRNKSMRIYVVSPSAKNVIRQKLTPQRITAVPVGKTFERFAPGTDLG